MRHTKNPISPNRGFTLIELLVVVAIIALLIAILLPSLGTARSKAKAVACTANLKQFALSYGMYVNDYAGWNMTYSGTLNVQGNFWADQMLPYFGAVEKTLICPAANSLSLGNSGFGSVSLEWNGALNSGHWLEVSGSNPVRKYIGSYGFNFYMYSSKWDASSSTWITAGTNNIRKYGQVQNQSLTPIMVDSCWTDFDIPVPFNSTSWTDLQGTNASTSGSSQIIRIGIARHPNKTTNMVFVDGHAVPVQMIDLYRTDWYNDFPFQDIHTSVPAQ